MPRTRNPYPTEFRDQIVALARAGRSVESLAREFEPCAATIHGWVKQVEVDDDDRQGGLSSAERCAIFAGRSSSFVRSVISCQRPRPGLHNTT